MDENEITIVFRHRVPKKDSTFNGLLRGLEQDKDLLMRSMIQVIVKALEEKAIEEYMCLEPDPYVRHGT